MMVHATTVLAIGAMACVTYLTRVLGFLLLRQRRLGPRATAVMQAAPGCVLIALIAPAFVSPEPADLLALAITVAAATRCSMLPTVLIGILSSALLRHFMP